MACVTSVSWPGMKQLKISKLDFEETILPQIKSCERENFSPSEAFDITSKLKKKNTSLICLSYTEGNSRALLGYLVFMHPKIGSTVTVHKICIRKSFRRRGCARFMLKMCTETVRDTNSRMHLWVRWDNIPARSLYRSLGFVEDARINDYYGSARAGLHMTLDLRPS